MEPAADLHLWLGLALPVAVLLGAWAGLSGFSGWAVVFPILLVVWRRPLFECIAGAMCVDWANAAAAALVYAVRGDADRRTAWGWAAVSVPAVLLGVALAWHVLPHLGAALGGGAGPIALAIGAALLVRAIRHDEGEEEDEPARPPPASAASGGRRAGLRAGMLANGALIGAIGQGGGFNAAVLLLLLRGYDTRAAVATGLLVCALAAPAGLLVWLVVVAGAPGLWRIVLPFATVSALASATAAWQAARIPRRSLGFVVAGCVLLAGVVATAERWLVG